MSRSYGRANVRRHPPEPYSLRTAAASSRLRGARASHSVCPYCAVGCGQLEFVKEGTLIAVEGDPRSPVNEGRLCPKGANTLQLATSPHRVTTVRHRAPGADRWEERSVEWAVDRIATLILESRARGFVERMDGITVNHVKNIALIGGSAQDNEEVYLARKLLTGGLGVLPVENQARLCHSSTVAGLGASFGFGAMTNPVRDLANSDCILIMGSNMAESHPVGFHWPLVAQARGATLIHVDPRFTRTSAVCDVHVPIRPGTDLAFIAGMIRHVLEEGRWFREYVAHYTNAATILREDYGFDEETGLFAGWDPEAGAYDLLPHAWDYEMETGPDGAPGPPRTDPAMEHPRCVLQVLRRHVARYTPSAVAEVCGCRPADVVKVAELMCRGSGRERTAALAFSLGFTQHATGPQTIRAAAILQLLLGNMGRPGGGVAALRGHANVQGATDIPLLYDTLPNYLPMPHAVPAQATLGDYLRSGHAVGGRRGGADDGLWRLETSRGAWASLPAYIVSLLVAWYGDAARADDDFGYGWLPKIDQDWSEMATIARMHRGELEGLILFGQNPGVSGPNARLQRDALRRLDWMVVLDLFETESASAWYADPEGPPPEEVGTEVLLLPVAASTEKEGTITNTERLVQWHDRAIEPPGDCRSDLWWIHAIGRRIKEMVAGSELARDLPLRALTWDYDDGSGEPSAERVLREMNGFRVADGGHVASAAELAADGSTACGCRLYAGIYPEQGRNLARRLDGRVNAAGLAHGWGWAWPGNARILYNRASADPEGRPWSAGKRLVWWDEAEGSWTGDDVPQFDGALPPGYRPQPGATGTAALPGDAPFTAHLDGRGWLFAPFGLADGPLPVHYEPLESPVGNRMHARRAAPLTVHIDDPENRLAGPPTPEFPHVATTYHLTEHFMNTRNLGWLADLQPAMFVEIDPVLAEEHGIADGGWVTVTTPRRAVAARALVTGRVTPLRVDGRTVHVVGIVNQFGYRGEAVGASANDVTAMSLSASADIHGAKSFVCRIEAGRAPADAPQPLPRAAEPLAGRPVPATPWAAQPNGRPERRGGDR